jgi:hypothetical protein
MIDFVDFGCGIGGSIEWAKAKFGGETYLGIDNRTYEVSKAVEKGFNVILADLNDEIDLPQCRYVTMLHFLEHLENEQTVKKNLKKAIKIASDFVFIKVPFFDATEYLKTLDFRLTWTNWKGHKTPITFEMLKNILNEFSVQFKIGYQYPVLNSDSKEIIPLSSPIDTLLYDEKLGLKKFVEFENVYREMYCYININCKNFKQIIKTNIS